MNEHTQGTSPALRCISSMATKEALKDLVARYAAERKIEVTLESAGGIAVEKRLRAGEAFDLVVLGSDAIDALIADGTARPGSRTDLVRSAVTVAVRAGSPRPDIGSAAALKAAILAARSVGYSTGPSGVALAARFEAWGIADQVKAKLVVPPPGTPVGTLIARGEVELGFQQMSELIHVEGIDILGPLPADAAIISIFSGAVCAASARADQASELLDWLASPEADAVKRREGMEPA